MFKLKKAILCGVCSLIMLSAFGCSKKIDINEDLLLKDSGKYIDCSEFFDLDHSETSLISVDFDSKEEFYDFLKNKDFSNEEKAKMALMADEEKKLKLPDTSRLLGVTFDGKEDIDEIEWYGGNRYTYRGENKWRYKDFDYLFEVGLSAQDIDEFINERYTNKNYDKKEIYQQNYIKYTTLIITSPLGFDTKTTYWDFSDVGYTYYIHEVSGFTYREAYIIIESEQGYGLLTVYDMDEGLEITPEFLKKFVIYSYTLE